MRVGPAALVAVDDAVEVLELELVLDLVVEIGDDEVAFGLQGDGLAAAVGDAEGLFDAIDAGPVRDASGRRSGGVARWQRG